MTPKSAEALRVEAHQRCGCCDSDFSPMLGAEKACRAIDLYAAARAVEVAEGMHEAGCDCRPGLPYVAGACTPYCNGPTDSIHQDQADPRCTEARARLRAEMERLTHAD